MKLNREDIEEFKKLYREEFGEELSDAEAQETGSRVLRLYEVLLEIAERMVTLEKDAPAAIVKEDDAPVSSGRTTIRKSDPSHAP